MNATVESVKGAERLSAKDVLRTADIHDERAFAKLSESGPLGLGEAYEAGYWDADRLDVFMCRIFTSREAWDRRLSRWPLARHLVLDFLRNPQRGDGAFVVGREHYDLGNDLFRCMLDESMTYTCGYWDHAETLGDAQTAKLDLTCRKLGLQPGMRLLDIGCGWGNFARYAVQHYGVSVVGLTVSAEQARFARENCADLPVEIRLQDYRECREQFDAVVSIEMIEAVGRQNLEGFFEMVHACLADQGRFLLQAIHAETFSAQSCAYLDLFMLWLVKYIFPNGYVPNITEIAAPCRRLFRLVDWHDLTPSYDRTLLAWKSNFAAGSAALPAKYDDAFRRRWTYYLLSCAAAFRCGLGNVCQVLYSKGPIAGHEPQR